MGAGAPPGPQSPEQEIKAIWAEQDRPGGDRRLPDSQKQAVIQGPEACTLITAEGQNAGVEDQDGHDRDTYNQPRRGDCKFDGPGTGEPQAREKFLDHRQ